MADTHEAESRPTQTRSRPDADSILSGLQRMRSGDATEQVTPTNNRDEDPNVDDTDDHGDAEEVQARAKPGKAKPAKKPAPAPEPEDDPEDDPDLDEESDLEEPAAEPDEIEEPEATAEEPVEEEPEEPAPDPELERRARQLRKQEQRIRDRARAEREEIQRDRESLRKDREQVSEFNRLKERAKHDPVGVLRHLGLTDDDFEPVAKHIYAQTKEAAKDPKNREAADRAMRERELQATIDSLKSRLDEQDKTKAETARQERERAEAVRYMTGVSKAAKPGTLAAHYLGKGGSAAGRAMQAMAAITAELAEDDELPLPSEVLAEYEKRRRAELEDDGVDVNALLKRRAAAPAAAASKKPANGAAKANGKPATRPPAAPARETAAPERKPARIIDPEERKDAVLRDLSALREKKRQAAVAD